jgi:hypothetical protein
MKPAKRLRAKRLLQRAGSWPNAQLIHRQIRNQTASAAFFEFLSTPARTSLISADLRRRSVRLRRFDELRSAPAEFARCTIAIHRFDSAQGPKLGHCRHQKSIAAPLANTQSAHH